MIKPRGHITRSNVPKEGYARIGEPTVQIVAWGPDLEGKAPPEQVHFIMHLPGLETPLVMRFKSPDSLGFFIEELARYRQKVWPEAEPVNVESFYIGRLPEDRG